MCGIVGIATNNGGASPSRHALLQMLGMIRHRGPDQFGIYHDARVGLGSARLSIVDLQTGQQPITNEDQRYWIVYNGEVYNHKELRSRLIEGGHRFSTQSDTEVILHLYEDLGAGCVEHLNGQFAFAIWDSVQQKLFLARDRMGIRPLFYWYERGTFLFASEIKAILSVPQVQARADMQTLRQIFTFWSALSPRTFFQGVQELPPGCTMQVHDGKVAVERYYQLNFPLGLGQSADTPAVHGAHENKLLDQVLDPFMDLLVDATRIRLRADVPVGAYLSGGLDSSTIAAIIRRQANTNLDTFSIAFEDPVYDERAFQSEMAAFLGTQHQVVDVVSTDVAQALPDLIWHTEVPILRTSPAPLYMLSDLVHQNQYKVVLTGEGADEILAGYNIFKENKVRRFWAKQPESGIRPLLLRRLYAYIPGFSANEAYLKAFFGDGLTVTDDPYYSHALRWRTTSRTHRFFHQDLWNQVLDQVPDPLEEIQLPPEFLAWHPLNQAQYLEMTIFLSQYLLSSQGDRPAAAHSVETRFPFLDHRLVEFCNQLPPGLKLYGLTDKYLLRKAVKGLIPDAVAARPKVPYRAPIHQGFFGENSPEYVAELLSEGAIRKTGWFKPAAVEALKRKAQRATRLSESDDMALAGILTTQLAHDAFLAHFQKAPPVREEEDVLICTGLQGAP